MDGNLDSPNIDMLINFGSSPEADPAAATQRQPLLPAPAFAHLEFVLPSIDDNNPFDLLSHQTAVDPADDPFESVFNTILAYKAPTSVATNETESPESFETQGTTPAVDVDNAKKSLEPILQCSPGFSFDNDASYVGIGDVSDPSFLMENMTHSILGMTSLNNDNLVDFTNDKIDISIPLLKHESVLKILPPEYSAFDKSDTEAPSSNEDLKEIVNNRVKKCISAALHTSRNILDLSVNNLDACSSGEIKHKLLPRPHSANTLRSDQFEFPPLLPRRSTQPNLDSVREALNRLRPSSVSSVETSDLNRGFIRNNSSASSNDTASTMNCGFRLNTLGSLASMKSVSSAGSKGGTSFVCSVGNDSVFEEAIELADAFKVKADSFRATDTDSDGLDDDEDLLTCRPEWETSLLKLPKFDNEEEDSGEVEETGGAAGVVATEKLLVDLIPALSQAPISELKLRKRAQPAAGKSGPMRAVMPLGSMTKAVAAAANKPVSPPRVTQPPGAPLTPPSVSLVVSAPGTVNTSPPSPLTRPSVALNVTPAHGARPKQLMNRTSTPQLGGMASGPNIPDSLTPIVGRQRSVVSAMPVGVRTNISAPLAASTPVAQPHQAVTSPPQVVTPPQRRLGMVKRVVLGQSPIKIVQQLAASCGIPSPSRSHGGVPVMRRASSASGIPPPSPGRLSGPPPAAATLQKSRSSGNLAASPRRVSSASGIPPPSPGRLSGPPPAAVTLQKSRSSGNLAASPRRTSNGANKMAMEIIPAGVSVPRPQRSQSVERNAGSKLMAPKVVRGNIPPPRQLQMPEKVVAGKPRQVKPLSLTSPNVGNVGRPAARTVAEAVVPDIKTRPATAPVIRSLNGLKSMFNFNRGRSSSTTSEKENILPARS